MNENELRVQMALQALERRDVDALLVDAHPEIVFGNPPYALEPGTRIVCIGGAPAGDQSYGSWIGDAASG